MNLKGVITLTLLLLLFGSVQAEHQQRVISIVVIESMTLPDVQARTLSFKKHLHKVGLYRNNRIQIRVINAEADPERGRLLLQGEIATKHPDLVVSIATLASQAARDVLINSDIPQLFLFVSDPVNAGLANELGKPTGSNISGITHGVDPEVATSFLLRMVAAANFQKPLRIGVLHSNYPSSIGGFIQLKALEKSRTDIHFVPLPIRLRNLQTELPLMVQDALAIIENNREELDLIWLADGPLPRKEDYVRPLTRQSSVPIALSQTKQGVDWGVWFSLFSAANQEAHQAALLANAILHGEPIESIPVMRSIDLSSAVNPRSAKRWGYQLPEIGR